MTDPLARITAINGSVPAMTELVLAFSELRKQSARAIGALSASHGISPTDMRALSFVSLTDKSTPKAVAEHLGITTGSLTTLADRLEVAGLLERTANPADRRSLILRLTERGIDVMSDVNDHYVLSFSEAFDDADIPWMKEAFVGLAAALGRLAD